MLKSYYNETNLLTVADFVLENLKFYAFLDLSFAKAIGSVTTFKELSSTYFQFLKCLLKA